MCRRGEPCETLYLGQQLSACTLGCAVERHVLCSPRMRPASPNVNPLHGTELGSRMNWLISLNNFWGYTRRAFVSEGVKLP